MNTAERIFQALIFEVIALAIMVPTSASVAGFDVEKMATIGVGLSIFAMLWNYVYNIFFDKVAGHNRIERGVAIRVMHAFLFEFGMVVITLPMIAWYLNITWLSAIVLEASFMIFILVYTFLFNWLYDTYQPYKKCFVKP